MQDLRLWFQRGLVAALRTLSVEWLSDCLFVEIQSRGVQADTCHGCLTEVAQSTSGSSKVVCIDTRIRA